MVLVVLWVVALVRVAHLRLHRHCQLSIRYDREEQQHNRDVVGVVAYHERPEEILSDADAIEPEPKTT